MFANYASKIIKKKVFVLTVKMILSILLNVIVTTAATTCSFSINQNLGNLQPLLIQTKGGKIHFVLPVNGTDQIVLKQNETIEAYCPGSFVLRDYFYRRGFANKKYVELKCLWGSLRNNNMQAINPYTLRCPKPTESVAQYTGWECYAGNKGFEIGFRYKKRFLSLITGCFDKKQQITLYTTHTITRSIAASKMFIPKQKLWEQGPFFNVSNVNYLYYAKQQQSVVNHLLGLASNSTKYISKNRDHYLTRGQLAPKADFLLGSQQGATYYLLNAVPQWQTTVRGNWQILEESLRKLAASRRIDLQIYSGVHDVLRIPHEYSGWPIKLYLSVQATKYRIPIPEYIWKIAYDRGSEAGVAFVAANNPFLGDELYWFKICKNICFKLGYVKLNRNYAEKGYVYCCEVNELRKRVKTIPNFPVEKLLT